MCSPGSSDDSSRLLKPSAVGRTKGHEEHRGYGSNAQYVSGVSPSMDLGISMHGMWFVDDREMEKTDRASGREQPPGQHLN